MANLSAAELQQKHNSLEGMGSKFHRKLVAHRHYHFTMAGRFIGAPDPFPSLLDNEPRRPKAAPQANGNGTLDNSESSFPSLAPNAASNKVPSSSKPSPSSWGAGSSALRKPAKILQPVYSSNFTLDKVELARGQDGKTITLGNVMKEVMNKTKTKIEASTQRTTGGTTFHIKGDSESAVDAAIRTITAALSPQVGLSALFFSQCWKIVSGYSCCQCSRLYHRHDHWSQRCAPNSPVTSRLSNGVFYRLKAPR
jgi:hypothetical protein